MRKTYAFRLGFSSHITSSIPKPLSTRCVFTVVQRFVQIVSIPTSQSTHLFIDSFCVPNLKRVRERNSTAGKMKKVITPTGGVAEMVLERRRTGYFYTAATFYGIMSLISVILVPIAMAQSIFFTIVNGSRYVEVASIFRRIELSLQGNCMYFADGISICRKMSFSEMFYRFPDFSTIPSKVAPTDLPAIFQTIYGQDPMVFIPLFILEICTVLAFLLSVRCMYKTARSTIIKLCIANFFLLIISALCLGLSDKIYGDVLPSALNKVVTVEVERDGGTVELTGRPTDIGIGFKWNDEDGRCILISLVVLHVSMFLVTLRWIFEGNTLKRLY
jgi:hypothetical protein